MTTEKEALQFVNHIKSHLEIMKMLDGKTREICCKICGNTITEIIKIEEQKQK